MLHCKRWTQIHINACKKCASECTGAATAAKIDYGELSDRSSFNGMITHNGDEDGLIIGVCE